MTTETKTTHTPGPWEINQGPGSHQWILGPTKGGLVVVADVAEDHHEGEANAHLIAAAPELLKVCKAIHAHRQPLTIGGLRITTIGGPDPYGLLAPAIAKAEP